MSTRLLELDAGGRAVLRGPFDSALDATRAASVSHRAGALLGSDGAVVCFRGQCLPEQRRRLRELAASLAGPVASELVMLEAPRPRPRAAELEAMCSRLVRVFRGGRR